MLRKSEFEKHNSEDCGLSNDEDMKEISDSD